MPHDSKGIWETTGDITHSRHDSIIENNIEVQAMCLPHYCSLYAWLRLLPFHDYVHPSSAFNLNGQASWSDIPSTPAIEANDDSRDMKLYTYGNISSCYVALPKRIGQANVSPIVVQKGMSIRRLMEQPMSSNPNLPYIRPPRLPSKISRDIILPGHCTVRPHANKHAGSVEPVTVGATRTATRTKP